MNSAKTKKHEAYLAFARSVGPAPTTALASAEPPRVSVEARRAAELLVGTLSHSEPARVGRVAACLDRLVAADSAAAAQPEVVRRKRARRHG